MGTSGLEDANYGTVIRLGKGVRAAGKLDAHGPTQVGTDGTCLTGCPSSCPCARSPPATPGFWLLQDLYASIVHIRRALEGEEKLRKDGGGARISYVSRCKSQLFRTADI